MQYRLGFKLQITFPLRGKEENTIDYSDDPIITKRVKFLKEAHVFFDTRTKQTFRVTNYEYQKCKEEYERYKVLADEAASKSGLYINPMFVLNGHEQWIWKEDEDYSSL